MTSTMTAPSTGVTIGVDTHKDIHVAAALDARGALLGTESFPTTTVGYEAMLEWATAHGTVNGIGVEGTGSWGAGLNRYLHSQQVTVFEVNRPNRQHRRRNGKSDTADAIGAARAVQSGEADVTPKTGDGPIEALRALRTTMRSAMKARTQFINQIRALIDVSGPALKDKLSPLNKNELVERCVRLRPGVDITDPLNATKTSLRRLARRCIALDTEIKDLKADIEIVVRQVAPPELLAEKGVGIDTAAALLIAAGDNPERMHSDAAFAALCGVSPIDASSGRQHRHRLNRGGNRDANSALWRIVLVKMATDPTTQAYIQRRTSEGKTKREAMRALKRHLARRYWKILTRPT